MCLTHNSLIHPIWYSAGPDPRSYVTQGPSYPPKYGAGGYVESVESGPKSSDGYSSYEAPGESKLSYKDAAVSYYCPYSTDEYSSVPVTKSVAAVV